MAEREVAEATATETETPTATGATGAAEPAAGATGATATGATAATGDIETAYGRQLRAREAKLVERQQRHAAERAAAEARDAAIAAREKAIAEREAELEADPLAYATKRKGWRDEDLARRFLNNGKPSPQEVEARRQAELDDLKARIDKREKAEAEAKAATETQARIERAQNDFKTHTTSKAADFPRVAALMSKKPAETLEWADQIAGRLLASGYKPVSQTEFWNEVLRRYDSHLADAGATGEVKPVSPPVESPKLGQQESPAAETDPAPTLSGKGAAKRSSVPKADDLLALELSDPEAAREALIAKAKEAKANRKKQAAT
jgi:hypothetical protein